MSLAFRLATLCTLTLAFTAADARMYQWVSQRTGTVQFSGEPPSWYRAEQGGPRVQVFENGNLVDDTAIALPNAQREELRAAAFQEAEQRRRAEAVKRLEQAARREERRQQEAERLARLREERERYQKAAAREEVGAATVAGNETPPAAEASLDEAEIARLKAIIAEFDRSAGTMPK